jgi:hypothetical protein
MNRIGSMLEPPFEGQWKECRRCGSATIFRGHAEIPGTRTDWIGEYGRIADHDCAAGWQCDRCGHFELWHRYREELKANLRSLRSCIGDLLAAAPYTVMRAQELSVEIVAYTLLGNVQGRQPGVVADGLKESLTSSLDGLRESAKELDGADFGDADRVRSVATTLLERVGHIQRLLGPGPTASDEEALQRCFPQ